jgi:hypothetical protein
MKPSESVSPEARTTAPPAEAPADLVLLGATVITND